jgi:hypothetical protein
LEISDTVFGSKNLWACSMFAMTSDNGAVFSFQRESLRGRRKNLCAWRD